MKKARYRNAGADPEGALDTLSLKPATASGARGRNGRGPDQLPAIAHGLSLSPGA